MEDSVKCEPNDFTEILQDVPELLKEKLVDLKGRLDNVEELVKLIESNSIHEQISRLSPLEQAKFDWITIYAINSLFFVYLKNNAVNLKDHPIMSELSRVKSYLNRINEISASEEYKNKSTKVDKESTARIIKRSLWMNANNKAKEKVSELVNATLESAVVEKRIQYDIDENLSKKIKLEDDQD
ncbi:nuclear nucleic acid-binding C1D [Brachionus plicatilis]|uniref:Nuclear nucleic acid-binding protein C1D n=1 Tax=Brachionus plicatilis TaxID=10195 RepID=A0A3M7QX64_BRAPC|nr:nuclear nucleic acid-binding C1D [Brachionus plicatilis]